MVSGICRSKGVPYFYKYVYLSCQITDTEFSSRPVFLTAESDNLSTIRDSTSLNGGVGRGQRSCDREGEPLLGWQDEPIMTMEWDTKWNTVAIGGIYRTDRRTVVKLSGGGIPAKLLVFGQSRLNSLAAHSAPLNEISIGLFRGRMRVGNFILGQIIFCSIS